MADTTDNYSGWNQAGFEDRFRVTRTDGRPINPARRYIVLDYAGSDPHARLALEVYAASIRAANPRMSQDIYDALANSEAWPAQHD